MVIKQNEKATTNRQVKSFAGLRGSRAEVIRCFSRKTYNGGKQVFVTFLEN